MTDEQKPGNKPTEGVKAQGGAPKEEHGKTKPTQVDETTTTEKKHAVDEAQRISKGLCVADKCKDGAHKFHFCDKHFEAFQLGLMTKHGLPAKDYEQKLRAITRKKRLKSA